MTAAHPKQRHTDLNLALVQLYESCTPEVQTLIDANAATFLKNYPCTGKVQLSFYGAREIVMRLLVCCGLSILE